MHKIWPRIDGAIALSYPPRVRVSATAKLSAAFFHDESSITIGGEVRKCNSAVLTCVRITLLDYIQYNAVLVIIGVIRGTSKTKLYNELSFDSLSSLEDG